VDHDVRVHRFERPFLSPDHPDHQSLVLLRHPAGAPAVELVAPVLTPPERMQRTELDLVAAEKGACHGTVFVPNLDETVELFTGALGFRRAENCGQGFAHLALRRPLSQWSITLTIREERAPAEMPTQDSEGWFVLALFSSDLEADARQARKYNVKAVTEPFSTEVSQQRWAIVLCILSSGFAVELLQPSKDGASTGG
jgi:hypothetical protein